MKRLIFFAFCLLALAALGACTGTYDDFVHPGKVHDPGTQ